MSAQLPNGGTNDPTRTGTDHMATRLSTKQLRITSHAIDRWTERICSTRPDTAPWDLPDAFELAIPVGVPNLTGGGRLHPPTRALFVYTRDYSSGPPIVVTVLDLTRQRTTLNDDHLVVCDRCGFRYYPARGECPWDPEVVDV